jgi:hypothetical protein
MDNLVDRLFIPYSAWLCHSLVLSIFYLSKLAEEVCNKITGVFKKG